MTVQRREARYELRQEVILSMRLCATEGETPREIRGVAVDLSKRGVKARIRESLPIGQKVDVQIQFPALAVALDTPGAVCWARPAENNLWWTGITIEKEIPAEIWLELSNHGFIDRREHSRSSITLPGLIRRELAGDQVAVEVIDFSHGGCRMRAASAFQEGERLLLSLQQDDSREASVMARVAWVRPTGSDFLIGCEFAGRDAFVKFRNRLQGGNRGVWSEVDLVPDSLSRNRLALSLLAGVASVASLLMWWRFLT